MLLKQIIGKISPYGVRQSRIEKGEKRNGRESGSGGVDLGKKNTEGNKQNNREPCKTAWDESRNNFSSLPDNLGPP